MFCEILLILFPQEMLLERAQILSRGIFRNKFRECQTRISREFSFCGSSSLITSLGKCPGGCRRWSNSDFQLQWMCSCTPAWSSIAISALARVSQDSEQHRSNESTHAVHAPDIQGIIQVEQFPGKLSNILTNGSGLRASIASEFA